MKKCLIVIFFWFGLSFCVFGQKRMSHSPISDLKMTIVGFLKWYKINGDILNKQSIIAGRTSDSITNKSVVHVDYVELKSYLEKIRESKYVSEIFLDNINYNYLKVDYNLRATPLLNYDGPIPGLGGDLIFGFEPNEILENIDSGRFTKIRVVGNKALVKFDISQYNQNIFVLSKEGKNWKIDYFGADTSHF